MNKKNVFVIIMLMASLCLQAVTSTQTRTIVMGGQYNDPSKGNLPNHRIPASPIFIRQDGHMLYFDGNSAGKYIKITFQHSLLYAIDELDGDWILDEYGIRTWVESLPIKSISMASLANSYHIIGL